MGLYEEEKEKGNDIGIDPLISRVMAGPGEFNSSPAS
jgi:hypothetical protein